MADVEDTDGVADGHVFGDKSTAFAIAAGRVLDGHVPAGEVDHAGTHLAMSGV
jgi:hypothetical protein